MFVEFEGASYTHVSVCVRGGGKHIGPIHYQMAINGSTNAHLNSVFKEELAMYRTGPQGPH